MSSASRAEQEIVLFDGLCNLCNRSVIFIFQQECAPISKFASLQSEVGRR